MPVRGDPDCRVAMLLAMTRIANFMRRTYRAAVLPRAVIASDRTERGNLTCDFGHQTKVVGQALKTRPYMGKEEMRCVTWLYGCSC
jgi:hypothetical protein